MSDKILITLPRNYFWTIGSVLVMGIHYLAVSLMVNSVRKQIFTEEFLNENFGSEHKQAYGSHLTAGGYPDNGEGRYAHKLPRKDWLNLKNAMRAQQNYKELLPILIIGFLFSGLFTPILAAILCLVCTIGRALYALGYKKSGVNGRKFGAYLAGIPMTLNLLYVLVRAAIGF